MLKIMKDRNHRAMARDGRGETRIEQYVEAVSSNDERKSDLFPNDSRGAERSAQRLLSADEIGSIRDQIGAGLSVGEHDVLVNGIDLRERGQQVAKINLRATDTAWNQVQRIDADAQHLMAEASKFFKRNTIVGIDGHGVPVFFGGLQLVALHAEYVSAVDI